ncbi:VanZ family protein [Clostridium botulinum]|nr:VanZ family protein [Clostridium botulinum]
MNFLIRKAAHITEYFILFMLLYYAFKKLFIKILK